MCPINLFALIVTLLLTFAMLLLIAKLLRLKYEKDNIHKHSWIVIQKIQEYEFEGQILERTVNTDYRYCQECQTFQKRHIYIPSDVWVDMAPQETEIVKRKYLSKS